MKSMNKLIFSQKLAGYLMLNGFRCLRMDKDKKQTGRNIFVFQESPELSAAIGKYLDK